MADHIRKQLREVLQDILIGLNSTDQRAFLNRPRAYPLEASELPGLVIKLRDESAEIQTLSRPRRIERVITAVKDSNIDVGAKTVESGGMEYVIRGRGFIGQNKDTKQALADIEKTVVLSRDGVPVRIRDLAQVQLGPDFRSGAIDLNGTEAVGGVVVMRFGENPREVIERVQEKIRQIEPSLKGVKVLPIYDRTGLINETVATLTESLREELVITAVVIALFLLHLRASLIVAVTLPMAVLMSCVPYAGRPG